MLVEDTAIEGVKIITPKKHGDERDSSPRFTIFRHGKRPDCITDSSRTTIRCRRTSASFAASISRPSRPLKTSSCASSAASFSTWWWIYVNRRRHSGVMSRWSFPPRAGAVARADRLRPWVLRPGAEYGSPLQGHEFLFGANDFGLAFDDPDLNIDWPVSPADALLSDKDRRWPRLRDLSQTFA